MALCLDEAYCLKARVTWIGLELLTENSCNPKKTGLDF